MDIISRLKMATARYLTYFNLVSTYSTEFYNGMLLSLNPWYVFRPSFVWWKTYGSNMFIE